MRRSVQTAAVAHGLAGHALGTLQHSPTQARHNSPPSLKISARSAVKLRSLWNFALYLGPLKTCTEKEKTSQNCLIPTLLKPVTYTTASHGKQLNTIFHQPYICE